MCMGARQRGAAHTHVRTAKIQLLQLHQLAEHASKRCCTLGTNGIVCEHAVHAPS